MKIINNADDFGYSNAVNYGIVDAHKYGKLTSTTIMANMPAFGHAVKLAKENPKLGVGVHMTLTCGKPLLTGHKTLIDENGDFRKLKFYNDETTSVDEDEVYREWKAQIDSVYNAGIIPTHLDSHHHIHTFKNNLNVAIKLAKEYGLPLRYAYTGKEKIITNNIKCPDILIDLWMNNKQATMEIEIEQLIENVIQNFESVKNEKVVEFMWHPAYIDYEIMNGSSFNIPRILEVIILKSKKLSKYFEKYELINYKQL